MMSSFLLLKGADVDFFFFLLPSKKKMVIVPPRHFVVVDNPVTRDAAGKEEYDAYGQVKLRHGDAEVRFHAEPFALFPGERLSGGLQPLQIVKENFALRIRAKRDFVDRYAKDSTGKVALKRRAGEEWMFTGLATYYPQSEEEIVQTVSAVVINPNQALKLKASEDCIDYLGNKRKAGESWLVRREGAYIPSVNEINLGVIDAVVLNAKRALCVRADVSFVDDKLGLAIERKSGEEWLVTRDTFETYIPDVNETIVAHVPLTVLTHRQWCIIQDPREEGTSNNLLGEVKYVRGPATFFLQPGERFAQGGAIEDVTVLASNEACWVHAKEAFRDHNGKTRNAGDKWLVYGPGEYWPPVQAAKLRTIRAFIAVEPLNFYVFQPVIFAVLIILLIIAGVTISSLFSRFGKNKNIDAKKEL